MVLGTTYKYTILLSSLEIFIEKFLTYELPV